MQGKGIDLYSSTNEWSGLIGLYRDQYWAGNPWLFMVPTIAFTLTIFAFNLILVGFKQMLGQEVQEYQAREAMGKRSNNVKNNKQGDVDGSVSFKMLNS